MTLPSPSDYCWVIGFTPQERWIASVIYASVEAEWQRACEIAVTRLGDDSLAPELMELAIQQTAEYLADLSPTGIEEVRTILVRFYRNAVRRRRYADKRLNFRGTSADLEVLAESRHDASPAIEAKLDLATLLRDTPDDLRRAMLLRYGARGRWNEVAEEMSKSEDAVRKSCQRELIRIRNRLGLKERARNTTRSIQRPGGRTL
jgi:DNA-directed RNA polymerase specialized sigma24 family protein